MDQKTKDAAMMLAEYFSQAQKRIEALERALRKEREARAELEKRVRKLERGDA